MKTILRSIQALFVALSIAAVTPACTMDSDPTIPIPDQNQQVDARVTLEDAQALAQSTLEAFNEGDYAGFSARWDAALKEGVDEAAFKEFRAAVLEESGEFVAITDARVTPGDEGHVRFTFLCEFEKQALAYYLSFPLDSAEITGIKLALPEPK